MLRAVDVSARLQGTRDELFSILIDYDRYSDWVPGLELSRTLAREGDVAVAEFRGHRISDRTFNLELIHSLPDTIIFRQIDSLDRPELAGRWEIEESAPGVDSPTALVRLSARVETPLFRIGSRRRLRSATRAGLDALEARCRHLTSARPTTTAKKQKLLEIVREPDGLRIWYLGESFHMPKGTARS